MENEIIISINNTEKKLIYKGELTQDILVSVLKKVGEEYSRQFINKK